MFFSKARPRPRAPPESTTGFAAAQTDSSTLLRPQDMRDVIKAENPSITFGETGKALGAKWCAQAWEARAAGHGRGSASTSRALAGCPA